MSDANPMHRFFGPGRHRLGDEEEEWSVWLSGMDEVHHAASLSAALETANEYNANFAQMRHQATSLDDPAYVLSAVVLHHGYAWTRGTEHRLGADCGVSDCIHCTTDRNKD